MYKAETTGVRSALLCFSRQFLKKLVQTVVETGQQIDLNIPLPPEGQKGVQFMKTLLGGKSGVDDMDKDGNTDWAAFTKSGSKDVEVWKPGWYLFMSKRLFPGMDQMMTMDNTLWQKYRLRLSREELAKKHSTPETQGQVAQTESQSLPQSQSTPAVSPNLIDTTNRLLNT